MVDRRCFSTLSLLFFGVILALLRIPDLGYIQNSLWAEDGSLFFRDAVSVGLSSLFSPYAGYLHLYPRIVALISSYISISLTPYLYFLAWIVSCMFTIYIILRQAKEFNGGFISSMLLISAVILQPNSGDVFFTITNSQWLISAAMIIWACSSRVERVTLIEWCGLLICALTGPFIILLVPAMLLRVLVLKDFRTRKAVYITVFLCAAIQMLCVCFSGRIQSAPLDRSLEHWLQAIYVFFSFGEITRSVVFSITAAFFWLLYIMSLFGLYKAGRTELLLKSFTIFLTAGIVFAAGLATKRYDPLVLHPLLDGSRYYFPAYALIFFAAFISASEEKILRIAMLALVSAIGIHSFSKIDRPSLQWNAYSKFATRIPGVSIPLSPQIPKYPGWSFAVPDNKLDTNNPLKAYKANVIGSYNLEQAGIWLEKDLIPINEYPSMIIGIPSQCLDKKRIALDMVLTRQASGWVKIFWRGNEEFSEQKMNRRFHDAGKVRVFFAINNTGIKEIRLDPQNSSKVFTINSAKIYCEN